MAYENVTPPAPPEYNTVTKYLYNGVELPNIDTVWTDKTTYPYALITKYGSDYCFLLSEIPFNLYDATVQTSDGALTNAKYGYAGESTDNKWKTVKTYTNIFSLAIGRPIWANYDIYDSSGTLYLAASDPVPVLAYPYYVLVFDYGAKESDWYQVHLYYSATAFTYDGSVVTNTETVFKQMYDDSIGAWTDYGELSEAVNLSSGLKDGVYQRIYTNHDILDGSGTVWLAADSVTPVGVSENWLRSFKLGLSLGLCGNALPWKAEPVAWLYNGWIAPNFPESNLPYRVITCTPDLWGGTPSYHLYLFSDYQYATGDDGSRIISNIGAAESYMVSYFGEKWTVSKQSAVNGEVYFYQNLVHWTNFDIYNEDGSVYIAASEPTPVYLPLVLFDGEVTTEPEAVEIFGAPSGHADLPMSCIIGDTVEVTVNGVSSKHIVALHNDFAYYYAGNLGLSVDGVEDNGADWLIGFYHYGARLFTRTAGVYQLKIERIATA